VVLKAAQTTKKSAAATGFIERSNNLTPLLVFHLNNFTIIGDAHQANSDIK
jgi:hypothetical protein